MPFTTTPIPRNILGVNATERNSHFYLSNERRSHCSTPPAQAPPLVNTSNKNGPPHHNPPHPLPAHHPPLLNR